MSGIKENIRAEIERRKQLLENGTGHPEVMKRVEGAIKAYDSILAFIDSLPEHPADGLEEEIERFKEKVGCPLYWCDEKEQSEWVSIIARHFAEWQKNKDDELLTIAYLYGAESEKSALLKKSIVGEIHHESDKHCWIDFDKKLLFDEGERVRVLVLETI